MMRANTSMKTNDMGWNVSVRDITLIGMMIAIIEVCKVTMMGIPNVELTSFWVIMFTLYFRKKVIYVIPAFVLIEGMMFGFGTWWIMYLYTWPALAVITHMLRKKDSAWTWSVLSGIFGLLYGMLCSFPYFAMGFVNGGFRAGLMAGFSWWVAGIPWDIVHGAANFILMFILYHPIRHVMNSTKKFLPE